MKKVTVIQKNNIINPPFRGLGGLLGGLLKGLLLLSISFSLHAQSGEQITGKAAQAYQNANGIIAEFVMNNSNKQGYAESIEGTIEMKGEKFVLSTPDAKTWYDGKTMWSYLDQTEEVNVTSPSGDDLRFTNPAILLANYKKDFTPQYKGEGTVNGKTVQKVELTPKTKGDISNVELQIEKATQLPLRITVQTKNGMNSTITIHRMRTGINQPAGRFVFNPSEYPNADIIDLR